MINFKDMYWSTQSTTELRNAMFNTDLLDSYRNDAKNEFIRRTTDYKIDDV